MVKLNALRARNIIFTVITAAGALFLSLAGSAPAQAGAAPWFKDAPPGMAIRWTGFYYITVPSDWKPSVERNDVFFYTGAHPDLMEDPSYSAVMLGTTRQKAPRNGEYRSFIADIEDSAAKGKVKNFSLREEEASFGGSPAVFWSFSGETGEGSSSRKMEGNLVVCKTPNADGTYTLAMLGGSTASIEKYRGSIKEILASAKEGPAPLERAASFPFGATQEAFRHSEGPFAAADGSVAVLDRFGKRVRIFGPAGVLLNEWGTGGKGEDGTFAWPTAAAFAPDGTLWVADEGYSMDAHLQHFSRKGEYLGKIKADRKKTWPEKGMYKPGFLAVTAEGKIVAIGRTDIGEAKAKDRAMVFSPSGELLYVWDFEGMKTAALLPGEKLVMTFEANDRSDKFAVFDLEGKRIMEWPFWGTGLPALPGDEKTYFRPKFLSSDGGGRVYAYDDSEYGIWMYDAQGVLIQVVPLSKTFGIVEGIAALPNGDLLVKDRPGGYAPGEPSVSLMKNAWPVSVPEKGKAEKEPAPGVSPGAAKDDAAPVQPMPGEESPEAELARLKEALRLREEAALLEKGGNLKGAAEKYRESLKFHNDPAVLPYAEGLEKIAALPPAAIPVPKPKPRPEPAVIPKESLAQPEQEAPAQPVKPELPPLPALEDPRKKAETLWNEAAALQQAYRYEEALVLYRKGLEISPDDKVSAHAAKLEAYIPKAKKSAEAIWNQAAGLQNAKKYDEALKKYREGLGIYYDKTVAEHAKKLEAFIARQKK